ncbi:S8 family serine peptidase, partial [uncultured Jatrophihabitans sp.]|uniref:S8 family serine peptidase n=1 Tax=uncultured Jatrophihabitans sp. TaxID=1610747 RepID=UPI0035CC07B0
ADPPRRPHRRAARTVPARTTRALLASALLAGSVLTGAAAAAPAGAAAPDDCRVKPGTPIGDTWPQRRLDFQQVWGLTRGRGVKVAVIDSGVNFSNEQMRGIHHDRGQSVIPAFDRTTRDCIGHGTAVAGIIAAQPEANATFLGVAPDVTLVPIKQTNTEEDKSGTADGIAAAIRVAIRDRVQVANISVAVSTPTPALSAAVSAARTAGIVLVAAAGNDGQQTKSKAYPAAYSTSFDNVIAVSATDTKDAVAQFSSSGGYVTVAAPGKDVPVPATFSGYFNADGTSFAAPYVTGTVALMLAATHGLTPGQVRSRLETTADAPPADVPDRMYGYGIVNPYLAVTALQGGAVAAPRSAKASPLPAPRAAKPADRNLQHVALGLAFGLIGLAVMACVAAGILRSGARRRPGGPATGAVADPDAGRGTLVRR